MDNVPNSSQMMDGWVIRGVLLPSPPNHESRQATRESRISPDERLEPQHSHTAIASHDIAPLPATRCVPCSATALGEEARTGVDMPSRNTSARHAALHCTLYTVQCTLYNVHCTLYTLHFTLYNVHCNIDTVHCALCTVYCTMYTVK